MMNDENWGLGAGIQEAGEKGRAEERKIRKAEKQSVTIRVICGRVFFLYS